MRVQLRSEGFGLQTMTAGTMTTFGWISFHAQCQCDFVSRMLATRISAAVYFRDHASGGGISVGIIYSRWIYFRLGRRPLQGPRPGVGQFPPADLLRRVWFGSNRTPIDHYMPNLSLESLVVGADFRAAAQHGVDGIEHLPATLG